jgi:hypothetical protein
MTADEVRGWVMNGRLLHAADLLSDGKTDEVIE